MCELEAEKSPALRQLPPPLHYLDSLVPHVYANWLRSRFSYPYTDWFRMSIVQTPVTVESPARGLLGNFRREDLVGGSRSLGGRSLEG